MHVMLMTKLKGISMHTLIAGVEPISCSRGKVNEENVNYIQLSPTLFYYRVYMSRMVMIMTILSLVRYFFTCIIFVPIPIPVRHVDPISCSRGKEDGTKRNNVPLRSGLQYIIFIFAPL